jgi:hypothetical protein
MALGSMIPSARREGMRPRAVALLVLILLGGGIGAFAALRDSSRPPNLSTGLPVARWVAGGEDMALGLASDGRIGQVRAGGRPLPMLRQGGGFSLRLAGGNPNLLPDSSFEAAGSQPGVPAGWSFSPGPGVLRLDPSTAHTGSRSIEISASVRQNSGSFSTQIRVEPNVYYMLSAWFRTQDLLPTVPPAVREPTQRNTGAQVALQQMSATGEVVATSRVFGYTDTAGWNRQFVGFKTADDAMTVRVSGFLRNNIGTAWFDDLQLAKLLQPGSTSLRGGVRQVTGAGSGQSGGQVIEEASGQVQGLSLRAVFTPGVGAVAVDGVIGTSGADDRPLQLTYTIPIDATGWQWGDYVRHSREVSTGTYSYLTTSSLQQSSRYPFGEVSGMAGLAVGVPPTQPRIYRINYSAGQGLSITFDLGLSQAAGHPRGTASFSFVVYTFDPHWGFRAATQKYYDLFPSSFVRRTNSERDGAWFVAPPLASIASTYREFGLGLNMIALGKASSQSHSTWGLRYIKWDNAHDIYTTAYTHEWAFYDRAATNGTPPYDQAIARLEAEARSSTTTAEGIRLRDEAAATLRSASRDFNGRLLYERYGEFLAYYENVDRLMTEPDWATAVEKHQVDAALGLAGRVGARLDGIHIDSTSGMRRWGAADDYDRAHWAAAQIPLTFSYDSGLVAERGIFTVYDRIRALGAFLHARGKILSANFNSGEAQTEGLVGADQIDYFGLEQGLQDRADAAATADQFAMVKRTVADQRPVSTLDHKIGNGLLTAAQIEQRLQQNLFYGIFSGAFNTLLEADAKGDTVTWSTASNAALWGRYAPIFRQLDQAGWEVLTDALSSNPNVWVERFGSLARGDLFFTVRNDTNSPQNYTLAIDVRALAAPVANRLSAREEVTGTSVILSTGANGVAISAVIPPHSTRVFSVGAVTP